MVWRTVLGLIALISLLSLVNAEDSTDLCTYDRVQSSYRNSFNPWFRAWTNVTSGPGGSSKGYVDNMACWWYADCIFDNVASTSQQQYSGIAIVMGLFPIFLKDIAWPDRRLVQIRKEKHWVIEILVRALGLIPVVEPKAKIKEGRRFNRWGSMLVLVVLVVFLLSSYGLLVVMELYSKRSSLGCPMPAWVVLWFVVALVPAIIEVICSRLLRRKSSSTGYSEQLSNGALEGQNEIDRQPQPEPEGIQGGSNWFTQFCWALYYSAGALIFTSIMLVTVAELFTWMFVTGVTTAASKMLGVKLCGYWGTGLK